MLSYHPMATYRGEKGVLPNVLWTSDGASTIEQAQKQFFIWANCYGHRINHAWIDVYERDKKMEVIEYFDERTDAERKADEERVKKKVT